MDSFELRNKLAAEVCKDYFSGDETMKGKIIKDLSKCDSSFLTAFKTALEDCHDYLLRIITRKENAKGFNTPYGKWRYLFSCVGRLVREAQGLV